MSNPESESLPQAALGEDRFSRLRLVGWWDQRKLADARVLVVGAGALGNEIIKNLALLGVRRIAIIDLDRVECSNLSRSVLFRTEDIGQSKAETAARAARGIYPEVIARALTGNVMYEVGLGVFDWPDIILGGLDNREARLWINRAAWKMNRPWIDGAIEGICGVARVFVPGQPPCYECTLGAVDWEILHRRMSCNLLTRAEMLDGKVPTTPTISSIIAGVQVQEAVKWLHGLPTLAGRGLVFEGLHHTSYVVEYTECPDCLSHETFDLIVRWPGASDTTSLQELLEFAQEKLGSRQAVLEFSRDIIHQLVCPCCHAVQEYFVALGTLSSDDGRCPLDGTMRAVNTVHRYTGQENFGLHKISQLGLPPFDVFTARAGTRQLAILIDGDRASVLGPIADPHPLSHTNG